MHYSKRDGTSKFETAEAREHYYAIKKVAHYSFLFKVMTSLL